MTPADLQQEFDCWKVGLRRCGCGSAVTLVYLPGATMVYCLKERDYVFGLPDWNPKGANEEWNKSLTEANRLA